MTTFTKLGAGETPLIEVDARKKLSKIDPMTYGGFTEYGPHLKWQHRTRQKEEGLTEIP